MTNHLGQPNQSFDYLSFYQFFKLKNFFNFFKIDFFFFNSKREKTNWKLNQNTRIDMKIVLNNSDISHTTTSGYSELLVIIKIQFKWIENSTKIKYQIFF